MVLISRGEWTKHHLTYNQQIVSGVLVSNIKNAFTGRYGPCFARGDMLKRVHALERLSVEAPLHHYSQGCWVFYPNFHLNIKLALRQQSSSSS